MEVKEYIFNKCFKNKKFGFDCDCIIRLDVVGIVVDYKIVNDEMVLKIDVDGRLIDLGLNTPGLKIKEIL